jgi:hypothetical protein
MKHRLALRVTIAVVVVCSLAGCGGSQPQPEPPAATAIEPAKLVGRWQFVIQTSCGGTYAGTLSLQLDRGTLTGSIPDWSNGARSRMTGTVNGATVHFDRVDDAPYTGFRTSFDGKVTPDGTVRGTWANDPSAPSGNACTGTWVMTRS